MSQTFVFEELDAQTREYLLAVRASEGDGAPGVYAPTNASMAGCGALAGVVIIVATLLLSLTTWVDVVYKDPARVAFLQTAGLLLGGWLLVAAIRSAASKGGSKVAGHWVYADPLHLYEAYREQVTVTPIGDLSEAKFTHNYNNGAYQNSVVQARLDGGRVVSVTLNNEARAEQLVVYLNYLAWARSSEGGDRKSLAPASLGGIARYVSVHDAEPKNHEDQIDLNLVELEITEVPEEPAREGRAAPSFLPYVFLLLAGVGIYFLMRDVVDPPLRDDAIYSAITNPPQCVEPWFLQQYLLDERNTRHREEVKRLLAGLYDRAIGTLQTQPPGDPKLRDGMIEVLRSLKDATRPVVSLRVSEVGGRDGAQERVERLRDGLVGQINAVPNAEEPQYFTATGGILGRLSQLLPPVSPPAGMTFPHPRTAVGFQLIEFASKPEEADHAHFEVKYEFVPLGAPRPGAGQLYALNGTVEIRTDLAAAPVASYTETMEGSFREAEFGQQLDQFRNRVLRGLVGQ